jgi:hypothetical protein
MRCPRHERKVPNAVARDVQGRNYARWHRHLGSSGCNDCERIAFACTGGTVIVAIHRRTRADNHERSMARSERANAASASSTLARNEPRRAPTRYGVASSESFVIV